MNELRSAELSEKLRETLREEKLNQRDVSALLRMKVIDLRRPDCRKAALFTVWKPTEDVISLFSEGKAYSLLNVSPGNSR